LRSGRGMAARIAVIGAGPAGLSAAHTLSRAGASTTVFEARAAVGGRTWTEEVEGFRVDAATQLFGSMYTHFFRLLREAGGEGVAVGSPGRDALLRRGRVHEVVYGNVASMLSSGAVPLATKLRLGTTYLPFLTRHGHQLDLHALERAAEAGLDREPIAAWGRREMGEDFVEYLAYPLLATGYGVTPEETGAAFYHMLAHHGTSVRVYALRGGASAFCEFLAGRLREDGGEVRLSTPVERVEERGEGVDLSGTGWSEGFDAVVVATPAPVARRLLSGSSLTGWLEGVRMRPTLTLALLLDRPLGVRWFGLSFPRSEARTAAVVCAEENKGPGLVPPGKGLLVVFPSPAAGVELAEAEPRRVLETLLPDVARALPGVDRRVTRARTYRWPEGWTLFPPGHAAWLAGLRRALSEDPGRVALAGDYLHVPSVEGAVMSGVRAAERVLGSVGAAG
jgi:oxygen-dependent protoporphyrinogen oxidase